jgi:RNA polymerase subunit RPABC4/transcription elongation factor Spt4
MALVKCRACWNLLYSAALVCPYCGVRTRSRLGWAVRWGMLVLIGVVVLLWLSRGGPTGQELQRLTPDHFLRQMGIGQRR